MSRSSARLSGVSYGAVGASQAPDLLAYPPRGFRAAEHRTRIGHGDQRFRAAAEQALTWQLQQRSGIRVRVDDVPPPDETAYVPVVFDAAGAPVAPASPRDSGMLRYSADGVALISAGTTAMLTLSVLGIRFQAPIRVVQLIEEQGRRGFVVGTMRGHPLSGEESFVIEQSEDGAVWIQYRVFWRPGGAGWRLVRPLLALLHRRYVRRYLRALQAAADASIPTSSTAEVVPAAETGFTAVPSPIDADSNRFTGAADQQPDAVDLQIDPAELPLDAAAAPSATAVEVPAEAILPLASAPEPEPELRASHLSFPEPVAAAQLGEAARSDEAAAPFEAVASVPSAPTALEEPALAAPSADAAPSIEAVPSAPSKEEPPTQGASESDPEPAPAPRGALLQTSPLNLLGRPRDRPLLDGLPTLRGSLRNKGPTAAPVAGTPEEARESQQNKSDSGEESASR